MKKIKIIIKENKIGNVSFRIEYETFKEKCWVVGCTASEALRTIIKLVNDNQIQLNPVNSSK